MRLIHSLLFFLLFTSNIHASESLLLIGGGHRPAAALSRMVAQGGGDRARVLIVTWATRDPQETFDGLAADFLRHLPASQIEEAPRAPLDFAAKAHFYAQLRTSTAVFFSGGDQNRIMDVLEDAQIVERIRGAFRAGVVMGGTSAGTAMMSALMLTGNEEAPYARGLGLLDGVVLDTHFSQRKREHRMLRATTSHPGMVGIGIDEGTALWIDSLKRAEVIGEANVLSFRPGSEPRAIDVRYYKDGESFDL